VKIVRRTLLQGNCEVLQADLFPVSGQTNTHRCVWVGCSLNTGPSSLKFYSSKSFATIVGFVDKTNSVIFLFIVGVNAICGSESA